MPGGSDGDVKPLTEHVTGRKARPPRVVVGRHDDDRIPIPARAQIPSVLHFGKRIFDRRFDRDYSVFRNAQSTQNADVVALAIHDLDSAAPQLLFIGHWLIFRHDDVIREVRIKQVGGVPGTSGLVTGEDENGVALFGRFIGHDD